MKSKFFHATWLSGLAISAILFSGCSQSSESQKTDTPQKTQAKSSAAPNSADASSASSAEPESPAKPILATDFPIPSGADKPIFISDTSTVMYHQVGTVEEQAKFCTEQLEKLGWKKQPSSEIADGVAFLDFSKAQLSITVTINPLRDDKITTMAQGSGVRVPASLDDDESDAGESDEDDSDGDDSDN